MGKNRSLLILFIFCFSVVGFSAHITDEIANVSSADEALRLIANNPKIILLSPPRIDRLGQNIIEIRQGIDDYIRVEGMSLKKKWKNITRATEADFDSANTPATHGLDWETLSGIYELRINANKKTIHLKGPAFESIDLADGSVLLLLERNSKESITETLIIRDFSGVEKRASWNCVCL